MEGLGPLLGFLVWIAMTVLGAMKKRREDAEAEPGSGEVRLPSGAPPPPPPRRTNPAQALTAAIGSARASLERADELCERVGHAELEAAVDAELGRARELELRARKSIESAPIAPAVLSRLRSEADVLRRRASLLLRLAEARANPESGARMRGLSDAIEAAVPGLPERALVVEGAEGERGVGVLSGTGLLPLVLTGDPRRDPLAVGALVEDAWAARLFAEEGEASRLLAMASADADEADAMERFASALVEAWAPALLIDAACSLGLGDGHLARVQALAMRERREELYVVHLDASRRVDSVPPTGLRLLLLRALQERAGGAAAPPLPPNPVLHLRGPGVWDQVALRPIFDRALRAQAQFCEALLGKPGLSAPAQVSLEARELLEQAKSGALAGRPDPRALLSAFCSAPEAGVPADRLTAAFARAAPEPRARRARSRSERRAPSRARADRRRILREAVLLGEAFSGHRS